MASFDISVDEFLSNCSTSERKEIILAMIEDGFLPSWVIDKGGKVVKEKTKTNMELDYNEKLDLLKSKYYSLSLEDEESLNKIFKKYL